MIALKLVKEDRELYVVNNPTSYMLAIEYGWSYEIVDMQDNKILNTSTEIN